MSVRPGGPVGADRCGWQVRVGQLDLRVTMLGFLGLSFLGLMAILGLKNDSLCFDSRLAVEKVDLGPDEQNHIEFEMRNFRFRDTNSIGKQDQGYSDFKLAHLTCL